MSFSSGSSSPWRITGYSWQGNPVWRHRQTRELAQEFLQEGRLVALPGYINATLLLAREHIASGENIGSPAAELETENNARVAKAAQR